MKIDVYVVDSASALEASLRFLSRAPMLFLDIETVPKRPFSPGKRREPDVFEDEVRLVQIGTNFDGTNRVFIFDLFALGDFPKPLGELVELKPIVGHNLKFDLKFLRCKYGILPRVVFDTFIADQIISLGEVGIRHGLADLALRHTGIELDKREQMSNWGLARLTSSQLQYAARDVAILFRLFPILVEELNKTSRERQTCYSNALTRAFGVKNPVAILEFMFLPEVVELDLTGFAVDEELLLSKLKENAEKLEALVRNFTRRYRVNPYSSQQVGQLLERRGLELPRTEKGNIRTSDDVLSEYADKDEAVALLLEIRKTKKIVDKLKELANHLRGGRIYANYRQIGAATGRMSCANPNLQNIPRGEWRRLFVAPEGKVLIVADYPQIELRIAAEIANEETMIRAFVAGKDMHVYTASVITGKPESDITKEERQAAKAVNFGLIYGMSAKGLATYAKNSYGIDMDVADAEEKRRRFFEHFRGFALWHEKIKHELREKGYVITETIMGRRAKAYKFNDATNYPVQGTGADMLKLGVVLFADAVRRRNLDAKIVNLVHDEIVVEADESCAGEVAKVLGEAMNTSAARMLRRVPVNVESGIGRSWEEAK